MVGNATSAHPQEDAVDTLTIDASRPLGPINGDLVGFSWHEGGAPLATVEELDPHLVRVDGIRSSPRQMGRQ